MRSTAAGVSTAPMTPPHQASDEATADQLQLALDEGQAVDAAVRYLLCREAAFGREARAGEYQIALALMPRDPAPPIGPSASVPVHVAVVVRDGFDGRLVPELNLSLALFDARGTRVGGGALPFLWHPLVNHYGLDTELPGPGPFRAEIEIEPFRLMRHDPINGDRFAKTTRAEFVGLTADPAALAAIHPDPVRRAELAQAQGAALEHALATMIGGVAADGAVVRRGDYVVAYAVELAEGYFHWQNGELQYDLGVEESAEQNAHVEVAILDAETGRFLPALAVQAQLLRGGESIGTFEEPLMWHPWIYHYGRNWRVPSEGKYSLDIRFDAPRWHIYGAAAGPRFQQGETVHFDDVRMKVGQK